MEYKTSRGTVAALDNVSLEIGENQLVALVGESGCGKSTLGLSVIGLLPSNASANHGSIGYNNTDLLKLDKNGMRNHRGTEIAMIFQEPLTSLNPMYRVRDQIAEAIMVRKLRKDGAKDVQGEVMQKVYRRDSVSVLRFSIRKKIPPELTSEMIKWLNLVRIPDPEQVLDRYPFELSGGMSQRVMIAMALSEEPALLIADEPTTALDVTTQAQVLKLMHELMDRVKTSILLVTHDLAVAGQVADRVVVMYAGEIVEEAEVHRLFSEPRHPYTKGLLACIPSGTKEDSALKTIGGSIPNLMEVTNECKFAPRCPYAFDRCYKHRPDLKSIDGNRVACFLYDN